MQKREELTEEFIKKICDLYGDEYDDTVEDSHFGGENWKPGVRADHKSLRLFKEELEDLGIHLSTGKLRKVLITGGVYSTQLSRSVSREWDRYEALPSKERVSKVAEVLSISPKTVNMYLPYERQVYKENPSEAAVAQKKWRDNKNEKVRCRIDRETLDLLKKYDIQVQDMERLMGPERAEYYARMMNQ